MTDANGCPGCLRESVASAPLRPRYASVRARSPYVGSGIAGVSSRRGGPAWRLMSLSYQPRETLPERDDVELVANVVPGRGGKPEGLRPSLEEGKFVHPWPAAGGLRNHEMTVRVHAVVDQRDVLVLRVAHDIPVIDLIQTLAVDLCLLLADFVGAIVGRQLEVRAVHLEPVAREAIAVEPEPAIGDPLERGFPRQIIVG